MKPKTKCITPYCRNERAKDRLVCHKCHAKWYKENHPEAYFFNALRNNAKRRGKEFNLTLKEFKQFCADTGYMETKGKNGNDMSIDRIKVAEGYSIDNIQLLSLSDNTSKRNNEEYPF